MKAHADTGCHGASDPRLPPADRPTGRSLRRGLACDRHSRTTRSVAHRLGAPTAAVWAALGAIYVIWGATYLGMEIAMESIPPFLMASLRFLAAGAILFAIFRPRERPTLRHWVATAI